MESHARFHKILSYFLVALPIMILAARIATAADDGPTVAKDSVRAYVGTSNCNFGERGCDKNTSFLDTYIVFSVNGPIPSGSQLSVEFTVPGRPSRKWDCPTREKPKGEVLETECGPSGGEGSRGFAFQGPVPTGLVGLSIHIRNELQGINATLFSGKMKVGKTSSKNPYDVVYYVDEDWRIPIGYIFLVKAENNNSSGGPGTSMFHAVLWFRGIPHDVEAHLFYQGKDVAKTSTCSYGSGAEALKNTMWGGRDCQFDHVYDLTVPQGWPEEGIHLLTKNPGEYEVKVLAGGHLARSIKFTVDAKGIVDDGIATANKLGSNRVIVPVKVIGDQGQWDPTAWKTGAFYGNPLSGFMAPQ